MSESRNTNLAWFVAGVSLGAVAGILYAPKSGRETRADILTQVDNGREFIASNGREARQRISDLVDRASDAFDKKKVEIDSSLERGKVLVSRQKDQVRSAIDAGRQAIHEATAEKKS